MRDGCFLLPISVVRKIDIFAHWYIYCGKSWHWELMNFALLHCFIAWEGTSKHCTLENYPRNRYIYMCEGEGNTIIQRGIVLAIDRMKRNKNGVEWKGKEMEQECNECSKWIYSVIKCKG